MSKLLKTLDKLLRFKKQTMDALRLQLAHKQREIEKVATAIKAQENTMHNEQTQIPSLLMADISYTSFFLQTQANIQHHKKTLEELETEAAEILSHIQQEFSESKAYETAKDSILEKKKEEERRKENESLDDIAAKRR
jgi:flagellar export protein FliJ